MNKIKIILILLLVVTLYNCESNQKKNVNEKFGIIACDSTTKIPKYLERKVTLLDNDGNPLKDTIIGKIKRTFKIFKPCRKFIYKSDFYTKQGKKLIEGKFLLTATGKIWKYDEGQRKAIFQYQSTENGKKKALKYLKENNYPNHGWGNYSETGLIENENEVWIHPPRSNQYILTEIAPFPTVKFPLKKGKMWTSNLNIQNGWGIWENSQGHITYKITSKEEIKFPFKKNKISCYKVEANAKYDFGQSDLTYYFSEKYGFIKGKYEFYSGEKLSFVLSEIK